ncbi:MAG: glycosyltransferase [Acidobacteria bacterium]|nr:MAG: glycosyltransferase [Acidobacteriota bacterium]
MSSVGADSRWVEGKVFVVAYSALLLTHIYLLKLPYFWDEAGYYIPAARDLLITGSLIPTSTLSNAHPPLVLAALAMAWKMFGFTPLVTRLTMLAWAAFTLTGVFRLTRSVQNASVAIAAAGCVAAYPVFFSQSSLAHVDLAAAGLTFWGLADYSADNYWQAAIWFSAAGLAKETAVITVAALICRQAIGILNGREKLNRLAPLLASFLPLFGWYCFHYVKTGFMFGNPEFFRYNVQSTLQPLRILLAFPVRLWQAFGYLHLWLLTVITAAAMWLPPIGGANGERPRIALSTQLAFAWIILSYAIALSFVGGAVLARYMLPAAPLVIIVCVSTIWRRVPYWKAVMAIVIAAFCAGWFLNPPYGFSPEDNLAYRDYVELHQSAAGFLQTRYSNARVLTAWPASDELTRPYLGYVSKPLNIVRIEDFSYEQLVSATDASNAYDVALLFSTKYDPPNSIAERWSPWEKYKLRFFDYHRDLPPAVAARILSGDVVFTESRKGQWLAVIEIRRAVQARE